MTHESPPSSVDVQAFLRDLRSHRERLVSLNRPAEAPANPASLAAAIDAVSEHLLTADEELRVQSEYVAQSAQRLDALVAAYEELFASAPVAYLLTDADGLILRYNRRAARLLGLPPSSSRSRTVSNAVSAADRPGVRALVSRVRKATTSDGPAPVEASVARPDGTELPVFIRVRRSPESAPGQLMLHWELEERTASVPVNDGARSTPSSETEPLTALADAAADLAQQDSTAHMFGQVVARARAAIRNADEVGITLVRSRGRIESPASTGEVSAACDRLQNALHEGPCIGAIDDDAPIRVPDVANDSRWPRFGPQAAALGVGSMLALPLPAPRGTIGALNLYARRVAAFDDDDELVASAFATHAGIALAHAELEENLRIGLQTREEIGRAVGILMERHHATATVAFDMMVAASQHSHRKLRDVARWVSETGEDPSGLIRRRRA